MIITIIMAYFHDNKWSAASVRLVPLGDDTNDDVKGISIRKSCDSHPWWCTTKSLPHKARLEDAAFEHKSHKSKPDFIDRWSAKAHAWITGRETDPAATRAQTHLTKRVEATSLVARDVLKIKK